MILFFDQKFKKLGKKFQTNNKEKFQNLKDYSLSFLSTALRMR
jgi:hypothetical protein